MLSTRTLRSLASKAALLRPLPQPYLASMNPALWSDSTHQRTDIVCHPHSGMKKPSPSPPPHKPNNFPNTYVNSLQRRHQITCTPPPALGTFRPPAMQHWEARPDRSLGSFGEGSTFTVPTMSYESLFDEETSGANDELLAHLYATGIVLVKGTPTDDEGMRALADCVTGGHPTGKSKGGGPLRTLYGEVWHTSVGSQDKATSTADSAYTSDSLPLHTDMTYHSTPPGLQIFNMATPAADGTGASTYLDGFAAAERLRTKNADAFDFLTSTAFTYRSVDADMGWHLEASGPVIQLDPVDQHTVASVRHNDLDRLAAVPPPAVREQGEEEEALWYERMERAFSAWDGVITEPGRRLIIKLEAGDCTIVHNRRVMHGRESFTLKEGDAARSIVGCYTDADNLESRWRACFTKDIIKNKERFGTAKA